MNKNKHVRIKTGILKSLMVVFIILENKSNENLMENQKRVFQFH